MALKYVHRTVRAIFLMAVFFKMADSLDQDCYLHPEVLYPHAECYKYYQCYRLAKVAMVCPIGQNFNKQRGHCDYSDPRCDRDRFSNQGTNDLRTHAPSHPLEIKAPYIWPSTTPETTTTTTTTPETTTKTTTTPETTTTTPEKTTTTPEFTTIRKTVIEECRSLIKDIDSWQNIKMVVINCDKYISCARHGPVHNGCPKGMVIGNNTMCELQQHVQCEDIKDGGSEEYNGRGMKKASRRTLKDVIKMIMNPSD